MNTYELIYVVPSTVSETQLSSVQKHVEDVLKKEKAEMLHHKVWTRRKLAYKIRLVEHAYYVLAYVRAPSEALDNLQRSLSLTKDIVRHRIFACENVEKQKKYFIDGYKEHEQKQPPKLGEQEIEKRPIKRIPTLPKPLQKISEDHKKETVRKQKISPSLEDLDKKIDDILKGEIEL